MKPLHTPVPWFRNIDHRYPVFAGEAPNHVHVACVALDNSLSWVEKEANYRLITQAARMFETLQIIAKEARSHKAKGFSGIASMAEYVVDLIIADQDQIKIPATSNRNLKE